MTDKERWVEFLASFGITPCSSYSAYQDPHALILYADHGGVVGYLGFRAEVKFDADGKFVEFGVWE